MKTIASAFAIASIGVALISGCNTPQFSAKRDFQKVIPINSQVDINVETFNGSITVTPTDQSEIELVAHIKTYGYSQEDADAALEVVMPEIDTTASAITISCKKRNRMLMYSDAVSFELKVPPTWPLKLETSNGSVKTLQSRGPVTIMTSNGKIEVKEAAGSLKLSTSNGKVTVENSAGNIQASSSNGVIQLIGCSLEGKCKLGTSNGAISLSLADRIPVQLDASTSNGAIKFNQADVDLTKNSKSHIVGVLFGKANEPALKASLVLETSNGSITITGDAESGPSKTTNSETNGVSL